MRNKLICYAKLLRNKLSENGFILIKQSTSQFGIILEYQKHEDNSSLEKILKGITCNYRLEINKDNITIFLYDETYY